MGKKIFISYKYGDTQVKSLPKTLLDIEATKVRDYVNLLQNQLVKNGDHINKGEKDGESLANFKDATIQSRLADKIYDSSVTIILISKGMKEYWNIESEQWIPWEISYSLRYKTRNGIQSKPNAILAIILPDEYGNFEYAKQNDYFFKIIKNNMNNLKYIYPQTTLTQCSKSFILTPTLTDFVKDPNAWIAACLEVRENIDKYTLSITV